MKKQKLTFIPDIPEFYGHGKATINGNKGYFYKLCKTPTKEEKDDILNKYNNVVWLISEKAYAPELKTAILFVSNKVIK